MNRKNLERIANDKNEKLLISSCLLGICCKYSGESNYNEDLTETLKNSILIPICPEQLGGLTTPRKPAEIIVCKETNRSLVVTEDNDDVTEEFERGRDMVVEITKIVKPKYAILKDGSPSCGSSFIYDGTFNHVKLEGDGLLSRALKELGIEVFNENCK